MTRIDEDGRVDNWRELFGMWDDLMDELLANLKK